MLARRSLLGALSALPLAAQRKISITKMEVFEIKVNRRGNWILVRLHGNDGLTGIGDASHGTRDTIDHLKAMQDLAFREAPLGAGPFLRAAKARITNRGSICAMSALEQAIWDIHGKALGVPCYDLFGGALRKAIRNYANINRCTDDRTPAGFATSAKRAVADGFDAIKLAPFDGLPKPGSPGFAEGVDKGVACVAAVREVLGPDGDLLVDAHSHFDVETGLALAKRLDPLKLFWLEEVTPPADLPKIEEAVSMKTAGGETIYGLANFRKYLEARSVDIVMPDVKYCGGMLELQKAAALAEGFGAPVSPHGPASPVGNMAAAHVCATMPNFLILELGFGEVPWRADLIDPPEQFDRGVMTLAERPGLGIELNEKVASRYRA
jgi:galactonate dehydratase